MSGSERACAHVKAAHKDEDNSLKTTHSLGPTLESLLEELKTEITNKIEKELTDSQNARIYICQKYDELCNKIKYLSELDATVTGFRSDVRSVEKQVQALQGRVDYIEQQALFHDQGSINTTSSIERADRPALERPTLFVGHQVMEV